MCHVNHKDFVDTGCKLNVLKTLRRPEPLLNILCTLNLRPVSTEEFQLVLKFELNLN